MSPLLARFVAVFASVVLLFGLTDFTVPGSEHRSVPSEDRSDAPPSSHDKYIWPTDASTRITSEFAEYRSMHFHGGIDISTNGAKGYKVFAVNDGYIFRVRIQPNGYGKMLFVKHPDGYISTYAHLMGFNDAITKLVRREQYRRGTYAVDLTFSASDIPVHRGDIVAYTGDSGFGPPHLHFEIRDSNLNPVNPLLVAKFPIEDNVPPTFDQILAQPLDGSSTVNNIQSSKFFRRFPGTRANRKIPQKIIVHGKIGFGVSVHDRADGVWNRAGVHALQFYLDDSVTYSMTLDRVLADESKEIYLHYDYPTLLKGWGKFQKLYVETGTTLQIYNNKPEGTGVINTETLAPGDHPFRIVCTDFSGNTSTLRGSLLVNHAPEIEFSHFDDDEIVLKGKKLNLIDKYVVYGKKLSSQNWSQHSFSPDHLERDAEGVEIPLNSKDYDIVKVIAETKWGSQSPPLIRFKRKPMESARPVYLKTDIQDDFVSFVITATGMFTEQPTLTVQEGNAQQQVTLNAVDLYKYVGSYIPSSLYAGNRTATVRAEINGNPASASDEIELYSIPTRNKGSFTVQSLGVRFSYDSGAVYKPLHMQVSSEEEHRSKVYILEPEDQLINRGIRVSVPIEKDALKEKLALYFRSNGGWIFQTASPDSNGTSFSTTLRTTLGELALMEDSEEPRLGRFRLSPRKGKISASFHYFDNLSGVDADEIKMYIDDAIVIPEIDGEHHQVSFVSTKTLAKGKHFLKISVKDRMKNESVLTRTFSVR